MNKEQYVLELVRKGLTKEEIEILLKDKFPLEYLPAPATDIPVIHASEYQSIASTGGEGIIFTNITSPTWIALDKNFSPLKYPIILEIKDVTITTVSGGMKQFKSNKSGEVVLINTPGAWTLQPGHFYKFENNADPIDLGTSLPKPKNYITPQDYLDRTMAIAKKINEKVDLNTAEHGIHNLTDLTTGDAIYSKVEVGKIYFMAVDRNKQYLMQGLCISKNATQATFVGYSWNTQVKHTNTVWATANKGSTSGDTLSFNGVDPNDLSGDDNAIANVALVKSLISSGSHSSSVIKDLRNLTVGSGTEFYNALTQMQDGDMCIYGEVDAVPPNGIAIKSNYDPDSKAVTITGISFDVQLLLYSMSIMPDGSNNWDETNLSNGAFLLNTHQLANDQVWLDITSSYETHDFSSDDSRSLRVTFTYNSTVEVKAIIDLVSFDGNAVTGVKDIFMILGAMRILFATDGQTGKFFLQAQTDASQPGGWATAISNGENGFAVKKVEISSRTRIN